MFFNGQGRPIGYEFQRSSIAGATIRSEDRKEPQTLSRKDSERVKEAVKKIEQAKPNK